MIKFLISAFAFFVLFHASSEVHAGYNMQPDKKLHLEAGIIIGGASYFIGPKMEQLVFEKARVYPAVWSIGMAGLAGAGKEIVYDKWMGKGYPDAKDFYYTVAGGAISGLFLGILDTVIFGNDENNINKTSVYFEANPLNKNIAVSFSHAY